MKKRKFNVRSLCAKIIIYLPVILLNIFYFRTDLIGKYIIEEKFVERLGVIIPALIGVLGVFAIVSNNRKATYKEVVTKERGRWIQYLRNDLAELMGILEESDGRLKDLDEVAFKKDMRRVRELYFRIVSSLNVNGENEDLIEIRAILSLNEYIKRKGFDLPLNFNLKKIKDVDYDEEKKELKDSRDKDDVIVYEISGTSEEVIGLFTMIYKDTWEDAKKEAD